MSREKEEELYVSCEIEDATRNKIKEVRKMKGKRTGWLIKESIRKYLAGEIEI